MASWQQQQSGSNALVGWVAPWGRQLGKRIWCTMIFSLSLKTPCKLLRSSWRILPLCMTVVILVTLCTVHPWTDLYKVWIWFKHGCCKGLLLLMGFSTCKRGLISPILLPSIATRNPQSRERLQMLLKNERKYTSITSLSRDKTLKV